MFSLRNKRRLVKKSVNLNKYGPFFIIFPLPVMLKFTVHITAVHLFTCVAKAVTSRRSLVLKSCAKNVGQVQNRLFRGCKEVYSIKNDQNKVQSAMDRCHDQTAYEKTPETLPSCWKVK